TGKAPATAAEVFVGVGATVDTANGTIDTTDAIGFAASVDELTLVLVKQGATRSYTGLSIEGLSGSLVGIDGLTAAVSDVNVQVNGAADSTVVAPAIATRLDWSAFTPAAGARDLPTLNGLDAATALHADGDIALDLFGFVGVVAHFDLSKYETSGTDGAVTLTDADVLEFTLTGKAPATAAEVFVGAGATVDSAAGTIDTTDAIGFSASVDELTLVLVKQGTTRSYTGLSIEGLGGSLVGIDGLTAAVSD